MTERDRLKMWKYIVSSDRDSARFDEAYSEDMRNKVLSIINETTTDEEVWQKIYDNIPKIDTLTLKEGFQHLAIAMNKNCPTEIIEEIVQKYSNGKTITEAVSSITKAIIENSMYREMSDKTLESVWKNKPNVLMDMFYSLSYKGDRYYRNMQKFDIAEKNKEVFCNLYLRRKAMMRNWRNTPYHCFANNELAKEIIEHPKAIEQVRTAIAYNERLSDEVRNMAFDHPEGVNIEELKEVATPHMMEYIYSVAADTFTEQEINPISVSKKTYPKAEKKPYDDAMYFLRSLVINRKLSQAMENDLFDRLYGMNLTKTNSVLGALLYYTDSPHIIKNAESVKNTKDRLNIYYNTNLSKEIREKHMDEFAELYEKKGEKAQEYVKTHLSHLARTQLLTEKTYKILIENNGFEKEMAENPLTPDKWLKKIGEKYQEYRYAWSTPARQYDNWEIRMYAQTETLMIMKKYFDEKEARDFMQSLVYANAFPEKKIFRVEEASVNEYFSVLGNYNIYTFQNLYSKIPKEQMDKFKEEIKENAKSNPNEYLKYFYKDFSKNLEIIENVIREHEKTQSTAGYRGEKSNVIYEFTGDVTSPYEASIRKNPINIFLNIEETAEKGIPLMNQITRMGGDAQHFTVKKIQEFNREFESKYPKGKEEVEEER